MESYTILTERETNVTKKKNVTVLRTASLRTQILTQAV
jgi:hypothetical protein